jgi:uncharacterized membrane protein YgcG
MVWPRPLGPPQRLYAVGEELYRRAHPECGLVRVLPWSPDIPPDREWDERVGCWNTLVLNYSSGWEDVYPEAALARNTGTRERRPPPRPPGIVPLPLWRPRGAGGAAGGKSAAELAAELAATGGSGPSPSSAAAATAAPATKKARRGGKGAGAGGGDSDDGGGSDAGGGGGGGGSK